jgi:2-methylcitrate dehydratase
VDFPIGHRKRRAEGMPVLVKKFEDSVAAHFSGAADRVHQGAVRAQGFRRDPVTEFMARWCAN